MASQAASWMGCANYVVNEQRADRLVSHSRASCDDTKMREMRLVDGRGMGMLDEAPITPSGGGSSTQGDLLNSVSIAQSSLLQTQEQLLQQQQQQQIACVQETDWGSGTQPGVEMVGDEGEGPSSRRSCKEATHASISNGSSKSSSLPLSSSAFSETSSPPSSSSMPSSPNSQEVTSRYGLPSVPAYL